MYTQVTDSIRVTVEPHFLEEQSSSDDNQYFWAYQVTIENQGTERVTLQCRYWNITDSFGRVQEVHGPGVVGEHPCLEPGERFEYTSGTPLQTPSGIMRGHYEMEAKDGRRFKVEIPAFSLDSPYQDIRLN